MGTLWIHYGNIEKLAQILFDNAHASLWGLKSQRKKRVGTCLETYLNTSKHRRKHIEANAESLEL